MYITPGNLRLLANLPDLRKVLLKEKWQGWDANRVGKGFLDAFRVRPVYTV